VQGDSIHSKPSNPLMLSPNSPSNEEYLESQWNNDINFEEIDEDLANFQEDEMVQQALHRGVDLDKYGKELERDLRQVSDPRSVLWFYDCKELYRS
jgi:hypothetical protein